MISLLEIVSRYVRQGYTEIRCFPDEYMFLVNPTTMEKVRIYINGDVWESTTGDYVKKEE